MGVRHQYDNQATPTDTGEVQFQTDFDEVRVIVDEEPFIRIAGTQFLALNKYYKRPFIAGQLPVNFARLFYCTPAPKTSWPTARSMSRT